MPCDNTEGIRMEGQLQIYPVVKPARKHGLCVENNRFSIKWDGNNAVL